MSTHSLHTILLRLRAGGAEHRAAAEGLYAWVETAARRQRVRPDLLGDVVDRVAYNLVKRATPDWLATREDLDSYACRMVHNAHLDCLETARVSERFIELQEHHEPARHPDEDPVHQHGLLEHGLREIRERARALLVRVFKTAVAGVRADFRAGLAATFDQLCAISLDGARLRDLLIADLPALAHDDEALARAEAAAYQTHARMRTRLTETIEQMAAARAFTPLEAQHARECLTLLKRTRPKTPKPGGNTDEGGEP